MTSDDQRGPVVRSRGNRLLWRAAPAVALRAGRLMGGVRLRAAGADYDEIPTMFGVPYVEVHPGSSVRFGRRVTLVSRSRYNVLGVATRVSIRTLEEHASIVIGDDCGLSGTRIACRSSIALGVGVLVGADVIITDSDHHPVRHPSRRYAPPPPPRAEHRIAVGDNVFLGARSIVLKGVDIGEHAVVGAGTIVNRDVPAGTIVMGNPMQVVAEIA